MSDRDDPGPARPETEQEVRAGVREIVHRLAPVQIRVPGGTDLVRDFAFHSLALLELAFAVEERFGLRPLSEPAARGIRTTEDLEEHVVRELRESGLLV